MKNKKAVKFLGEHTVNLIITVIVVVILIVLVVKVYGVISENKLKKVAAQLEKIVEAVNKINELGGESKVEIFSPEKGWLLVTFPFAFPEGECRGEKSCLCVCEEAECGDPKSRKCEGFDFDIKVRGFVRTVGQRETGERYSVVIGEKESIELPVTGEITVSKEKDKERDQISIYGESYGQVDKGDVIYYKIEG